MFDSCCSNIEKKRKKKLYPFSHIMASRYKRYITYGMRARVETLGPIWAQNTPTYFISELMIEFCLVISEINKSTRFDNPGLYFIFFLTCSLVGISKGIHLTLGWISIQQYLGYISDHPISLMQSTPQLLVMH